MAPAFFGSYVLSNGLKAQTFLVFLLATPHGVHPRPDLRQVHCSCAGAIFGVSAFQPCLTDTGKQSSNIGGRIGETTFQGDYAFASCTSHAVGATTWLLSFGDKACVRCVRRTFELSPATFELFRARYLAESSAQRQDLQRALRRDKPYVRSEQPKVWDPILAEDNEFGTSRRRASKRPAKQLRRSQSFVLDLAGQISYSSGNRFFALFLSPAPRSTLSHRSSTNKRTTGLQHRVKKPRLHNQLASGRHRATR